MAYSYHSDISSTSNNSLTEFVDFEPFEVIIRKGSAKQIYDWVTAHPYISYKNDYNDVFNRLNQGYLEFIRQGKTEASIRKCHKMQAAFLSIYDLDKQLDILEYFNYKNCQTMMEFFSLLKFDSKNLFHQKMVKEHVLFSEVLTQAFHREDFDSIEYLENLFKIPLIEQCFNYTMFLFESPLVPKKSELSWHFEDKAFFKPYYDIIYNYSPAKEAWLNDRHLTIPNQCAIDQIRAIFQEKQHTEPPAALRIPSYHTLYQGLIHYEKILNYYDLSEKLNQHEFVSTLPEDNTIPVHKIKI